MPAYSKSVNKVILEAESISKRLDHPIVGFEHLLEALSLDPTVRSFLEKAGIDVDKFSADARSATERLKFATRRRDASTSKTSHLFQEIMSAAVYLPRRGTGDISVLDVLRAVLRSSKYLPQNNVLNRYNPGADLLSALQSEHFELTESDREKIFHETIGSSIPHQSSAPVRIEERDGRLAQASDRDTVIDANELDFNRWRAPVAEHLAELLDTDLGPGTNHERLRRRLLALAAALAGTIDDIKANQFRLGYDIESLGDLVGVYRTAADDMPTLNAAVFADVNRLHIQLMLGLSKLVAWSRFQRDADADVLHEGTADPAAVGAALAEAEAVLAGDAAAPIVDPELPRSFRWIREAIADPMVTTKRMVYGAVKSLENVVSFLGQIALRTARGTAEGVSTGISKAVAASLLIGLGGAALTLSGALPTQWAWLKPLLEAAGKLLHG